MDVAAADAEPRNVVVIGSGPAAYTAALYTARAGLAPLVFEGSLSAGGALMTARTVADFPGFPMGITGPELADELRSQAYRFGAELVSDDILNADLRGPVKSVTDTNGTVHRARTVILATGSRPRRLGLPGEEELAGKGVCSGAILDGHTMRRRDVAVVGGGDSALQEALILAEVANSVTVVHRRSSLRAAKSLQAAAAAHPAITFLASARVAALIGWRELTGLRLCSEPGGGERELMVQGVVVAIGREPRTELFAGQVDLDEHGYPVIDAPSTRTSLPGVFAAGDVADRHYRQAVTAAASGCTAALDVERFLSDACIAPGW
ncbi:NAD(P)/FAD-dependent oxidoreductase [Kitasatospora griseola]|uniref:NAD(P)/FAD-dependent oxidoreductase n=1 Tax=Kitasatospora griseola TaxID=2064 RepID=UPI003435EAC9